MKRYSTRGPVFEEDGGVFVLASEYDDDRALLEEAVELLESPEIYQHNHIKDFLTRAKEGLR